MEEDTDSSDNLSTENIVCSNSIRVEIDTSSPFESVKEAEELFVGSDGGGGQCIPLHLLRLTHENGDAFNIEELKQNLTMKEHQALNVLRQLEAAKAFVRELKLNHLASPCLMFSELNKAKLSLRKTFTDLALIQASVESLDDEITSDEILLENLSSHSLSSLGDFETDKFKKMMEASRYEVVRAMTEIERTKNSIRLAEMRLNAAKKMEEAAKALEAIAAAERIGHSSLQRGANNGFITVSFEEYETLVRKAAEEPICKNKFIDTTNDDSVVPFLDKFEEIARETTRRSMEVNMFSREAHHHRSVKFQFRNSHPRHDDYGSSNHGNNRTKTSIGDILGRKLILHGQCDDRTINTERQHQHVSLGQMLREQKRLIVRTDENNVATNLGSVEKRYTVQMAKQRKTKSSPPL